jgi:hypothetical protein
MVVVFLLARRNIVFGNQIVLHHDTGIVSGIVTFEKDIRCDMLTQEACDKISHKSPNSKAILA